MKDNFNIILLTDSEFPEGMAATAHIMLMAKGLIKNNVSVLLAIPSKSFNGSDPSYPKDEGIFDSIPYKFFNNHRESTDSFSLKSLKNIIDIAKFLKKRKKQGYKDIIVSYSNNFLKYFPVFWACYYYKIPLFPWEVEKRISYKDNRNIKQKLHYIGYKISDIILPKISTGFIVISSFLQKYYSTKINTDKIHISPILIDENDSKNRIELDDDNIIKKYFDEKKGIYNIIVYSGSFGEKDGFPYILKAFEKLLLHHPMSLFVTTGKPGKYNPIENILEIINELGIIDNFKYLGLVNRNELKFINQNADLLLVCRSNSEFANHGFPWKLGEYLMTKNPIIATKVGDIETYLQDNKEIFLAEPENAESIANKMIQVFDDYDKAKEIANNGYLKALEVFDYVKKSKELIEFIKINLK